MAQCLLSIVDDRLRDSLVRELFKRSG
ncbi:hypothetical protein JMJ77_0004599 [Colletotrichum scovillei]|uniref:Uncharacterized protein n=1 Tax=Colletotrichum scovillei TaxID=1209932 RepID=A0A9P7RGR7_9PEZI|nr:hypothetical protein JMJ77_0004599 [Colletotrichum scovillei]KAG7075808.1 hypothetical protein JMJ76_0013083 [Colletotrichum scovillei]KAG7082850.1 hypothetical protein JMJ78_0008304 [Colletotrichum scovillei]